MIGLPAMGYIFSDPSVYTTESMNSNFVSDIDCYQRKAKSLLECLFKYRKKIASPKDYQATCGPPTGKHILLFYDLIYYKLIVDLIEN